MTFICSWQSYFLILTAVAVCFASMNITNIIQKFVRNITFKKKGHFICNKNASIGVLTVKECFSNAISLLLILFIVVLFCFLEGANGSTLIIITRILKTWSQVVVFPVLFLRFSISPYLCKWHAGFYWSSKYPCVIEIYINQDDKLGG